MTIVHHVHLSPVHLRAPVRRYGKRVEAHGEESHDAPMVVAMLLEGSCDCDATGLGEETGEVHGGRGGRLRCLTLGP
jgi:hypothetical protein